MKQVFDQFLKFLHDGISAIFRFVEIIWTWSVDQISRLAAVPWQQWPLWKQFLLVLVLAAVVWALYRVGRELFFAGAPICWAYWFEPCRMSCWLALSRLAACGSSITSTTRSYECRPGSRPAIKPTRPRVTRVPRLRVNKATHRKIRSERVFSYFRAVTSLMTNPGTWTTSLDVVQCPDVT
jgi:hypothetical protein